MRLTVVLAALLVLGVVAVGVAQATGGPHGSYEAATDMCAACHRIHTAQYPKLLLNSNTTLCMTCHGPAATGADTNVYDGMYEGTAHGTQQAGLNSGGFAYAVQDTSLAGAPTSGAVTSAHEVEGITGYSPAATMWGAGAANSGAGSAFDIYCTSCHNPHGGNNYRILKDLVSGVPITVTQTDEASKSYTTPAYTKAPGTGQWEISSFCVACHTRYTSTVGGSGGASSADNMFTYRHRIDAPSGSLLKGAYYTFTAAISLPVSTVNGGPPTSSPDNRSMVCLTCHFAHGSKASMGTESGGITWPGGAGTPNGNGRSSLLRLDNRGVCQNCHNKGN